MNKTPENQTNEARKDLLTKTDEELQWLINFEPGSGRDEEQTELLKTVAAGILAERELAKKNPPVSQKVSAQTEQTSKAAKASSTTEESAVATTDPQSPQTPYYSYPGLGIRETSPQAAQRALYSLNSSELDNRLALAKKAFEAGNLSPEDYETAQEIVANVKAFNKRQAERDKFYQTETETLIDSPTPPRGKEILKTITGVGFIILLTTYGVLRIVDDSDEQVAEAAQELFNHPDGVPAKITQLHGAMMNTVAHRRDLEIPPIVDDVSGAKMDFVITSEATGTNFRSHTEITMPDFNDIKLHPFIAEICGKECLFKVSGSNKGEYVSAAYKLEIENPPNGEYIDVPESLQEDGKPISLIRSEGTKIAGVSLIKRPVFSYVGPNGQMSHRYFDFVEKLNNHSPINMSSVEEGTWYGTMFGTIFDPDMSGNEFLKHRPKTPKKIDPPKGKAPRKAKRGSWGNYR